MGFLTHFQLPIYYETGTHLLTSLKQNIATHISDHIHEWRCRHRLIKFEIPDEILTEWFTKSSINQINKDIAMGGYVTKEQVITRARYLELVYSQSDMLYDLLPNALRPSTDMASSKPMETPPVDGIIGSVAQTSSNASSTSTKQKLYYGYCTFSSFEYAQNSW